ncbi:MAG: type II and III secretion system protein family protein, partial [Alphaproteobacteria bacterium]|nr:type II and III secretion system protein family protein [Alphaproteobacteria bacterium]
PPPVAAAQPKVVPLELKRVPMTTAPAGTVLAEPQRVVPLAPKPPPPRPRQSTGEADVRPDGVIDLAVGKTRPIDLPGEVRDIVVGNPQTLDVLVRSATQVFLMGKAVGDTNVFFLGRDGRLIKRVEVNVQLDTETIRKLYSELMPDDKIAVGAVGDSVFLSGNLRSEQKVANAVSIARRFVQADGNVVNLLRVMGEHQVMLRVRVAEVQRRVVKQLGLNSRLDVTADKSLAGDLLVTWPTGRLIGDMFDWLDVSVDASQNDELLKVLAEPMLTAVSGEQASLLAGGEVPIASTDSDGYRTIEYRPFGVLLTFQPVVIDGGRINLNLQTQVSSVTSVDANLSVPTFAVRRAATTIELPSGGSFMIAGLLQNDVATSNNGLPAIKDLPIIGSLFRSEQFQRNETELVISVTAYVVQPTDPGAIALPTDGFVAASDLDFYLLGRLHKVYGREELLGTLGRDPLRGPVGYLVK